MSERRAARGAWTVAWLMATLMTVGGSAAGAQEVGTPPTAAAAAASPLAGLAGGMSPATMQKLQVAVGAATAVAGAWVALRALRAPKAAAAAPPPATAQPLPEPAIAEAAHAPAAPQR